MVTAGGPSYGPLLKMTSAQISQALSDQIVLGVEVARNAAGKMQPGGTLSWAAPVAGASVTERGSPPHVIFLLSAVEMLRRGGSATVALRLAPGPARSRRRALLLRQGRPDAPVSHLALPGAGCTGRWRRRPARLPTTAGSGDALPAQLAGRLPGQDTNAPAHSRQRILEDLGLHRSPAVPSGQPSARRSWCFPLPSVVCRGWASRALTAG